MIADGRISTILLIIVGVNGIALAITWAGGRVFNYCSMEQIRNVRMHGQNPMKLPCLQTWWTR